jgi:hypothetical protein
MEIEHTHDEKARDARPRRSGAQVLGVVGLISGVVLIMTAVLPWAQVDIAPHKIALNHPMLAIATYGKGIVTSMLVAMAGIALVWAGDPRAWTNRDANPSARLRLSVWILAASIALAAVLFSGYNIKFKAPPTWALGLKEDLHAATTGLYGAVAASAASLVSGVLQAALPRGRSRPQD